MKNTWNSKSAKILAETHNIRLTDINPLRADKRVTIEDVRCTHRDIKKMGYNVTLLVQPVGDQEMNKMKLTAANVKKLVPFWKREIESLKDGWPTSDVKVEQIHSKGHGHAIQVTFSVNQEFTAEEEDFELNMIIEAALDVDDDGNYPVYVNTSGNIVAVASSRTTDGDKVRYNSRGTSTLMSSNELRRKIQKK